MVSALKELETRIAATTGPDRDLDRVLATALPGAAAAGGTPGYTSSVDECLGLIGAVLPAWHWHIGHGPAGILPYASLSRSGDGADEELRVEASAPTVPLALLHAALKALISEGR